MMQVVLVMFSPHGERKSFSLPRPVTVIGRREDCDVRIPVANVSRKHCRLIIDEGTLRLEDMGSSNGTYHNGVRIQEAQVQPGDAVQVGPVVFTVQIDGVPADEEIVPPAQAGSHDETTLGAGAAADEAGELDDLAMVDSQSAEDLLDLGDDSSS